MLASIATFKDEMAGVCRRLYEAKLPEFQNALLPAQRHLYAELCKLPYDARDWWRDYHDIVVVTNAMYLAACESSIPQWLPTAALLHDRGYAALAVFKGAVGEEEYGSVTKSFWDSEDSRLAHSKLSREIASWILTGECGSERVVALLRSCGITRIDVGLSEEEVSPLLMVVEQHDLPLIGRYHEISNDTKHHFDADSLYSISITSFVKDYLFAATDPEWIQRHALTPVEEFCPSDLLVIRAARYFDAFNDLPSELQEYLLQKDSSIGERVFEHLREGVIVPHSSEAQRLTCRAFGSLVRICKVLEGVSEGGCTLEELVLAVEELALTDLVRG